MGFLDQKFRMNKARYVFQTVLMALSVMGILYLLHGIAEGAVVASFGASAFIVFTVPRKALSNPRHVIGGSFIGVIIAWFLHVLSFSLGLRGDKHELIYGALAVGFSMFIMVITDTEHPPGAGIALGLVMDGFDYRTAVITILALIVLSLARWFLKPFLIDLL